MKKLLILSLFALWAAGLNACQVIFENDLDRPVSVFDIDANISQRVRPGSKIFANQNPNAHAHLRIIFGRPVNQPQVYRLNQIACSKSHSIPVSASNILQGTINNNVLSLEQEQ